MSAILSEVFVIVVLLVLNGVFAMSELAVMTARKVRLERRAEDGDRGARAALDLAHDPTGFLSTVQVGITLIGVLAGAFGGATLSELLGDRLGRVPALAPYADALGLGIVVAGITYLSLVVGELVPKRVALSNPERVAVLVARPMRLLARVASPVVKLLTGPTNLLLRVLGMRMTVDPGITEEEIRAIVEQGAEAGVVEAGAQELVEGAFRLGDRQVGSVMTPRPDVEWLDAGAPPAAGRDRLVDGLTRRGQSRFVVCDGSLDVVLGVVHAEDLLARCLEGAPLDLRASLTEPLYVPVTMSALRLLESFRSSRRQVAVALDEYGGVQGVVTRDDLVEEVVGALPAGREPVQKPLVRRPDGSWLADGGVSVEDAESALDIRLGKDGEHRGYHTLAGLVMALLGHVPAAGEAAEANGARLEVVVMDGRRIGKVRLVPPAAPAAPDVPARPAAGLDQSRDRTAERDGEQGAR